MSSFLPDTDNFFKYILTIGVLMILFGLVYPLKQEQLLRTKLIEIREQDSLLKIEVHFLEMQVDDLDSFQRKTQKKVDELNAIKHQLPSSEQLQYDEKIVALVDKFYEKRTSGLNVARDARIKRAKLEYEQRRYNEAERQINEYFVFKTIFWGLGSILMIAGLLFWMDSTYFEERNKVHQSQLQPPYVSKYVQCLSFFRRTITQFRWLVISLTVVFLIVVIWLLVSR